MRFKIKNIILVLPFLFVVLGPLNALEWKKLDMKDAEISVTGDESFITGRSYGYSSTSNLERMAFSGGMLIWHELNTNVYWGDGDMKAGIINNFNGSKYFSRHVPLDVKTSDLKYKDDSRQGYYWVSQEGERVSCMWATGGWGGGDAHGTGGNNRIVVFVCRPGKKKPLEEFVHDLMDRVKIDGGAINKMRAAGNYNAPKKQAIIKKEVIKEQPSPTQTKPSSNQTIKSRLAKLKKLLDAGLITKEEAAEKRKAILDSL